MRSPTTSTRAPYPVWLAILPALAAVLLYAGNVSRPLDVPDLDFVSDSPRAAADFPRDQVWFASFPPDRPDLGMYRPTQGQLLQLEYKLSPGKPAAFRSVNLLLLVAFISAFGLLAARLLRTNLARAAAVFGVALHPMATESVNLISAQGALLAGAAWVAALWVYQLALEGKLRLWVASPLVAILYFIAFGAHEAAALLPLSLIALEAFNPAKKPPDAEGAAEPASQEKQKKKRKKHGAEADDEEVSPAPEVPARGAPAGAASRIAAFGFPMGVAAMILLALRWVALDGAMGAAGFLRPPGGGSIALALARLFLPLRPTSFYPAGYESALHGADVVGLAALLAAIPIWIRARNRSFRARREAAPFAGAALCLIPLLPLIETPALARILGLHANFSERLLLLALPGFGLWLGGVLSQLITTDPDEARYSPREKAILGATLGLLLLFAGITTSRNREWRNPAEMWEAEARRHPKAPGPLNAQLIQRINDLSRGGKPFTQDVLADFDALTSRTLSLAKPPDADPALQYMALIQAGRRDVPATKAAVERGLAAPGPHSFGFFYALGSAAQDAGLVDLADSAFQRELKLRPTEFNSLYRLCDLEIARGRWEKAVEYAKQARSEAPSHLRAQCYLREGIAAARLKTQEGPVRAYEALVRALALEPGIAEAYTLLARICVDRKEYDKAEQILGIARSKAVYPTYAELFAIQVDSLERQRKIPQAGDFLTQMTTTYNWDGPLALMAGNFFLKHRQPNRARAQFRTVLGLAPNHPDAAYGMGRIAADFDKDNDAAIGWVTGALAGNPDHAEARALYAKLTGKEFNPADLRKPAQ